MWARVIVHASRDPCLLFRGGIEQSEEIGDVSPSRAQKHFLGEPVDELPAIFPCPLPPVSGFLPRVAARRVLLREAGGETAEGIRHGETDSACGQKTWRGQVMNPRPESRAEVVKASNPRDGGR